LAISQQAHGVWQSRLKEARLAAGISQRQLGIEAGIDEAVASTRVNRYELGVHAPDFGTSRRLAHVLGVPVAFLYCDDDELASLLLALHRASAALRKRVRTLLSD
jgi:transcriptional regulator with XRE-family HTH domain